MRLLNVIKKTAFLIFAAYSFGLYSASDKTAVINIFSSERDNTYLASAAYSIMNDIVKLNGIDTSAAVSRADAEKMKYYEIIDLAARAGAETVLSGEIRKDAGMTVFRFFAINMKGNQPGKIFCEYSAVSYMDKIGEEAGVQVCAEHVMRFLEKYKSQTGKKMNVPDYYSLKKKNYLAQSDSADSLKIIFFTPLISAASLIFIPYEYSDRRDWKGLSLYGLNALPYYAASGVTAWRMFSPVMNSGRKPTKTEKIYMFYNFAAGGIPHYISLTARGGYDGIRSYSKKDDFFGNRYNEVYFSIIGMGSNHFYKGHEFWGYFYYHADMLMVIASVSSICGDGFFGFKGISKKNRWKIISGAAALRLIEAVHSHFTDYDILNGEEKISAIPYLFMGEESIEGGLKISF